ncbi:class I adenylate-forming enzyme family protein [Cellulomonas wangsupingiae]|uniref:Acyl--CoA ligase n=1 Tax=Cellulomonas wangsupingiae TaxID=2968085 RepID=A0ABY5KCD9_9CELL|nr:class I adenylate-forming enzyme family protein [Cellulomonas wangsupingiae]MCC2333044.1 acyl--CoA ligase [Cellulomonas wangsupingiae]UUI66760.1 acyl--CoA ligase [Cellulomonas wangsupingiae]
MSAVTLLPDLLGHAARTWPGRTAVLDAVTAVTYEDLQAHSARVASWLADAGVGRGDRVVVALPADATLVTVIWGVVRAGAVLVVVRDDAPAPAVVHVLDDAQPVLVLSDADVVHDAAHAAGVRVRRRSDLPGPARPGGPAPAALAPGTLAVDPALFVYTSGSTGMPKAVVSTHAQVTFAVTAIASRLRYRWTDVVHCVLPLSFDYGLYQVLLCAQAGAALHVGGGDEAGGRLLAGLRRSRASVLPAVPSLAANLARLLERPGAAPPDLRLLTSTGATMPPEVLAVLRARIPTLRVQLMFGLTECKRAAILDEDEDLLHPGACGRALPGTEILAVGPDGRPVPRGQLGELVVRGPHVMAGYWRRPELTAQRFVRRDGLFPELRTGDHGWVDPGGYVYFAGRRDDVYKERGTRVSATEVEAAAHRCAGVEEACVVLPGPAQDGAALVVVGDVEPDGVLRALRGQLEDGKIPARCVVVGAMPLTANGKLDRARLRDVVEVGARA